MINLNSLFEKAKLAAFKALPSSVAPENAYAKSFGALLCLGVSADLEFDVQEFQQASAYIERDISLRNDGMTVRAIEYFRGYCDAIKKVMQDGNLEFPSVQTEMIAEVRNCPEAYVNRLRAVIAELRSISNPQEAAVLDRIAL